MNNPRNLNDKFQFVEDIKQLKLVIKISDNPDIKYVKIKIKNKFLNVNATKEQHSHICK